MNKTIGIVSGIGAALMATGKCYLATRVINISKFGYLLAETILGLIIYTPLLHCRNKLKEINLVNKEKVLNIGLYQELPFFISELCLLKAYEKKSRISYYYLLFFPVSKFYT